jgi:hypothetical protein
MAIAKGKPRTQKSRALSSAAKELQKGQRFFGFGATYL